MTAKGVAYEEDYGLGSMRGDMLESVTGETETGGSGRSNQVKRLCYIRCFNAN